MKYNAIHFSRMLRVCYAVLQQTQGNDMAGKISTNTDQARKSDSLSLRLDPATKWGLELLSRAQRRPITGVVEWLIAEAFKKTRIETRAGAELSVKELISKTWGSHELARLIGLWQSAPDLLSFEERRLMDVLVATPRLWDGPPTFSTFKWEHAYPAWERLRPVAMTLSEGNPIRGIPELDLQNSLFGSARLSQSLDRS